MDKYNETIESLEKIEKMIKESENTIKDANELLEQIGADMQKQLQSNLLILPEKLKTEIDKIKNGGPLPQVVTTTKGENFILIEPAKNLTEIEQNKVLELERNRVLTMLTSVYEKIINYKSDTIKPTSLPSLTIQYEYENIKVGLNTPEVVEMADQINTLNDYISSFEYDIKKNTELIDKKSIKDKVEIVEQAKDVSKCTELEEKLIKEILHGKGITPAIGITKERTKSVDIQNER